MTHQYGSKMWRTSTAKRKLWDNQTSDSLWNQRRCGFGFVICLIWWPFQELLSKLPFLSLVVDSMGRGEMASCLGTTSKQSSSPWRALVFTLGCSNKVELGLLKVLILGFKVCCRPSQQEGNGDTNSLFILPWRQSLCLPLGEHCPFPSPQNWKKGWSAIFTSSLSEALH